MIKIYGIDHCSSTQKIAKLMKEHGFELTDIKDIRQETPSVKELRIAFHSMGEQPRKLLNTSGQLYRSIGLKDKVDQMTVDELFDLLHQEGMLIKRPFLTDGKRASTGTSLKDLSRIWEFDQKK